MRSGRRQPADKPPYVFIGGTSEPGGLHVHTAAVVQAVAAAGHPVSILSRSVDHFSSLLDGRIPVTSIPPRQRGQSAIGYWRQWLRGGPRPVAVLCRGKLAEGSPSDLLGIRLASRRQVTIEHRELDRPWTDRRSPTFHGLAMRALVHRVVAVSAGIARSATDDLGLPASRVATCLNWVHPAFRRATDEERAAAKRRLGLDAGDLVIGYHGRLAPEKRVDRLVDALAEVLPGAAPHVRAVIAGDGWKRAETERRAGERGLADRVMFVGWQPDPAATAAAFDVAVLPSLFEGFPLALMESMALGSACLAHPMSSTRTLIESGRNGVIGDLKTPATFARSLHALIHCDPAARARMGAAAADTIAERFSRERRLPDVLEALGVADIAAAMAAPVAARQRMDFRV